MTRALRSIGALMLVLVLTGVTRADVRHCYDCHKDLKQEYSKPVVHDPVARGDCESCHKRHGFAQTLVLKDKGPGLCTGCHPGVLKETDQPVVHQAVKEGLCWTCHEPHATKRKKLLRDVDDKLACFVCHEEMVTPDRQTSRHQPFTDEDCSRCHLPHAGPLGALLRQPADSLCAGCHEASGARFASSHPDATRGLSCTTCHDAHNSSDAGLMSGGLHGAMKDGDCSSCHTSKTPNTGDLTASDPELCLSCHSDVQAELGRKLPHEAAASSPCLTCHEPHQSRHAGLLNASQRDLCGSCHELAPDSVHARLVHEPYRQAQCSSCHEAHGSETAPLLRSGDAALCTSCHSDSAYTAPQHAPASDCLLCHQPHQAEVPGLLKESPKSMCTACHEVDPAQASSHEPYRTGNCVLCHAPHSSSQPHLARAAAGPLCTNCHMDIQRFLSAPVKHEPAAECLECHAPHGSERPALLRGETSETCGGCHERDSAPAGGTVHTPYGQGDCAGCHNPHGSDADVLLGPRRRPMATPAGEVMTYPRLDSTRASLCRTCHGDVMRSWDSAQIMHAPVKSGSCETCHVSHAGEAGLLTKSVPRLCVECHEAGPTFVSKHEGADVRGSNCVDCHDPHASDVPALVRNQRHPPFADGDCSTCHETTPGTDTLSRAGGSLCAQCHDGYTPEGTGLWHEPVQAGECTACHSAHASARPKMLRQDGERLCGECHESFESRAHLHKPVADGQCLACHPAHQSTGPELTVSQGSALCLGCHEGLSSRLKIEQVHSPVAKNCLTCHDAHGGALPGLLKSSEADLCGQCHPRNAAWNASHLDGQVKGGCVSCHDPHSVPQGQSSLLYVYQHEPFASRDCGACHQGAAAPGADRCGECHDVAVAAKAMKHTHPPAAEAQCLSCHRAHAGPVPKLLLGSGAKTCGGCHQDLVKPATFEHPPASECENCHQPHGGEHQGLLTVASEATLCVSCHEGAAERHFHPMGDKAADPETGGPLQCSACHDPHGSEEPMLLRGSPNRDLCVRCHDLSH